MQSHHEVHILNEYPPIMIGYSGGTAMTMITNSFRQLFDYKSKKNCLGYPDHHFMFIKTLTLLHAKSWQNLISCGIFSNWQIAMGYKYRMTPLTGATDYSNIAATLTEQ